MFEDRLVFKNFKDEYEERISRRLFYKFITILFVFYIFLLVCSQSFYANYAYVGISGLSMQSTLNPNPKLIKTEKGYEEMQDGVYLKYTKDIDYGDIIILNSDLSKHESIIKRTIGLGGDYITIALIETEEGTQEFRTMRVKNNSSNVEVMQENYIKSYEEWSYSSHHANFLTIDGVTYQKTFFEEFSNKNKHDYKQKTFKVDKLGGKNVTFFQVPENEIFFMGDNRANSTDARSTGCYSIDKLVGKVVEIVKDGTYYQGNQVWWWRRLEGFVRISYNEVLRFFGADV